MSSGGDSLCTPDSRSDRVAHGSIRRATHALITPLPFPLPGLPGAPANIPAPIPIAPRPPGPFPTELPTGVNIPAPIPGGDVEYEYPACAALTNGLCWGNGDIFLLGVPLASTSLASFGPDVLDDSVGGEEGTSENDLAEVDVGTRSRGAPEADLEVVYVDPAVDSSDAAENELRRFVNSDPVHVGGRGKRWPGKGSTGVYCTGSAKGESACDHLSPAGEERESPSLGSARVRPALERTSRNPT